jgi:hypothetical protein
MAVLLYIRLWNKPVHHDAVRTPLIVPILFAVFCLALVGATILVKLKTAKMALLFLALGFVFYFLFMWEKTLQRFDWYKHWANFANSQEQIIIVDSLLYPIEGIAHYIYNLDNLAIASQIVFNGALTLAAADKDIE